jgi:hypothetical protein
VETATWVSKIREWHFTGEFHHISELASIVLIFTALRIQENIAGKLQSTTLTHQQD